MVKLGPYEVKLVDAGSGRPFTEHTRAGKTYFESEPEAEYFISMANVDNLPNVGFRFTVDGQKLGSDHTLPELGVPHNYGLLHINRTQYYHKALKFVKPPKGHFEEYNNDDGKIAIQIYEVETRPKGILSEEIFKAKLAEASERGLPPSTGTSDSKYVRSAEGSATTPTEHHTEHEWKYGKTLGRYVIHYCSAEKLVALGVLPRAASSGIRRTDAASFVSPSSSPIPVRLPTRIRVQNRALGFSQEYDLFDLTGEDSDDSDDSDDEDYS